MSKKPNLEASKLLEFRCTLIHFRPPEWQGGAFAAHIDFVDLRDNGEIYEE